jgi:hypothetical protein
MSAPILNVFSESDIQYLLQLPEVQEARSRLRTTVSFTIPVTETIRTALTQRLGLDLGSVTEIPMRWIKGDTAPHIDSGTSAFEQTYLVYLNDSQGSFILGTDSYPIQANTAFVFNEGVMHKTEDTGLEPRLLVGPMSEQGFAVGVNTVYYYPSFLDALNGTNLLGFNGVNAPTAYIVGDVTYGTNGGYTRWLIANIAGSTGTASRSIGYTNGSELTNDGYYYLYPGWPCFKEGTKILCQENGVDTYKPIESLVPGTLVKTSRDGYKKVEVLGQGTIQNPGNYERYEDRLYKCTKANYPELTEDLFITGCHSILVNKISDKQREETIKHLGRIFVTDKKYRLMACLDDRAEPFASEGNYPIYHFALEDTDELRNFGIYANGLLVETCSLKTLKNKSNMSVLLSSTTE